MVRLLTPGEAAAREAARANRGRPSPHMFILVIIACLCAGFFMGTTSMLPWQHTSKRYRLPKAPPSKVWPGVNPGFKKRLCEDSCAGRTRNGVCDEGRPTLRYRAVGRTQQDPEQSAYDVHCDLGTDCGDCGTWYHTNTHESDRWRPIRDLRKLDPNFTLRTRLSATPAPFWMAYGDAAQDRGVSAYIHKHTLYEHGHTWIWHSLLKECVLTDLDDKAPGSRQVVADVGANFGYYSLLAASMGCRVFSWEPVPYFAAYFKYALLRNSMTHAVELRDAIAGSESGTNLTILAALEREWGAASVDGANIHPDAKKRGKLQNVTKPVERVDEVVKEDLLVMKVDVEGHEMSVLRSAKQLLMQHVVKHVFIDYSPGVAEKRKDWAAVEAHPASLIGLLRAGYTVLHLPDDFREAWPDWNGKKQLPDMQELVEPVLQHDLADARRMREGSLGCPLPQELKRIKPPLFACGALPEALDPHSFRATFDHSTKLWAFKMQPWFANIGSPAGLVPLSYDVQHHFFVKGGEQGMARRPCLKLDPSEQVRNRCPCTAKDECGELERLVTALAADGKLPPFAEEQVQGAAQAAALGIDAW